ncbi:MAG: ribosomal protein S18-alanine N-acetyltransferase [Clostridia bacterium]|nr:ribosomal protein S18-alanine N-acetyltransferase [Clostridia bacterium]
MITLRHAQEADLPFLMHAESACFSDPFSETALRPFLTKGWSLALLAEEEGETLGYLLASVIAGEGEVVRVATLPKARKRGAARALLSHLLPLCDTCFLEVRESNTPARSLYESMGFRETGKRRGYYKSPAEDAVLYQWTK